MNRIKEHIGKGFLLGVMIICLGMTASSLERYSASENTYMLYEDGEPLSGEEGLRRQEENESSEIPLNFTLWGSQKKQTVSYDQFSRSATADLIYLCGSSRLIFPEKSSLESGDMEGCLISEDVAYKLYGNKEAKGNLLVYNQQEYVVRGVIQSVNETIVIQADHKAEKALSAVALQFEAGKKEETLRSYQNQYGDTSAVEITLFRKWGRGALGIFLGIVAAVLFFQPLKKGILMRKEPVKCLLWMGGLLIMLVIYWWITDGYMKFSFAAAPTKWSDFGYWQDYFKTQSEQLRDFIILEKQKPEIIYVDNFIEAIKYLAVSTAIFLIGVKRWKINTINELYLYSIVSITATFIGVLITGTSSRTLWLLMPVYFLYRYVFLKAEVGKWEKKVRCKEREEIL